MSGSPIRTGDSPSTASPLHGRYLATDWRLRGIMAASDLLLASLRPRRSRPVARPGRVLLSINGHLGDAVIATGALGMLVAALPDAEIGLLLPSWSRVVFEGDARVRHVHTVDHWHTSRASTSLATKWRAYRQSRRRAIAELRRIGYDAAIDLYDYFPNAALLLWRAGIPVRIGFDAAGFSALYTHAVAWPDDARHSAQRQQQLLQALIPSIDVLAEPRPSLPPADADTARRVAGLLDRHGLIARSFTLLHPGAGAGEKSLAPSRWRELAERLSADGDTIVLTGRGELEKEVTGALARDLPGCIDLGDALAWPEFVQLVRLAGRVISLDSAAGHVAAAVGTPSITLWTSPSLPQHWRPLGTANRVVDGRSARVVDEVHAILSDSHQPVP